MLYKWSVLLMDVLDNVDGSSMISVTNYCI
jgi:hypothetical protein